MRAVIGLLEPHAGERILDAGCGSGQYSEYLAGVGVRVTALDFSPSMLDALRQIVNIDVLCNDLTTATLEPVFDKILCAGSLEFVPDPGAAIRNLAKGLRPDGEGVLVLMDPGRGLGGRLYRWYHRRHGFSVQFFSRDDLERMAAAAGPELPMME